MKLLAPLAAFVLASFGSAQVALHVVDDDGGPGVDFTTISTAVLAAAPGDVLLVRAGQYSGPLIDGKGLVIVVEPGAAAVCGSPLRILNTGPADTVAVRGLRVSSLLFTPANLQITGAEGAVLIEESDFGPGWDAGDGANIEGSQGVHLVRCNLIGSLWDLDLGEGLYVNGSRVALYESVVRGGNGQLGAPGHPGARAFGGSELFASSSAIVGGDAGHSWIGGGCDGTTGGGGLVVEGSVASTVRLLATSPAGGQGGSPAPGSAGSGCSFGSPGPTVVVDPPSEILHLPGVGRASELDALVVEGGALGARLAGAPGDLAFLVWSLSALPGVFVPAWHGTTFLASAPLPLAAGALPPSGKATLSIPIPVLGLGDLALPVYGHGLFVSTGSQIFLGSPSVTVVVGSTAMP